MKVHVHIPKTGGTYITDKLQELSSDYDIINVREGDNQFGKLKEKIINSTNEKILVSAHRAWGLHEYFDNVEYFTILRHPIQRIISEYLYIRDKAPNHPMHKKAKHMDICEFVNHRTDNEMTRILIGDKGKMYEGNLTTNHTQIALHNLQFYYESVFLFEEEKIFSMLHVFSHILDIPSYEFHTYYNFVFSNHKTDSEKYIPSTEEMESIVKYNQADIDLYYRAYALFS